MTLAQFRLKSLKSIRKPITSLRVRASNVYHSSLRKWEQTIASLKKERDSPFSYA